MSPFTAKRKQSPGAGFSSPGMLKIIADVHQQVDEHRERNGQPKWDWKRFDAKGKLIKIVHTGWIAKLIIGRNFHSKTTETNLESEVFQSRLPRRDSGK